MKKLTLERLIHVVVPAGNFSVLFIPRVSIAWPCIFVGLKIILLLLQVPEAGI